MHRIKEFYVLGAFKIAILSRVRPFNGLYLVARLLLKSARRGHDVCIGPTGFDASEDRIWKDQLLGLVRPLDYFSLVALGRIDAFDLNDSFGLGCFHFVVDVFAIFTEIWI